MASKCFMCGAAISEGILCEKCDKPRKGRSKTESGTTAVPKLDPSSGASRQQAQLATAPALVPEAFPKAPILPFPVESASLAITSVANVLIAAGVASIVLAPDRSLKFVTSQAKKLFGVAQSDLGTVKQIEQLAGVNIGELAVPASLSICLT